MVRADVLRAVVLWEGGGSFRKCLTFVGCLVVVLMVVVAIFPLLELKKHCNKHLKRFFRDSTLPGNLTLLYFRRQEYSQKPCKNYIC